jgi:hypothetical protein
LVLQKPKGFIKEYFLPPFCATALFVPQPRLRRGWLRVPQSSENFLSKHGGSHRILLRGESQHRAGNFRHHSSCANRGKMNILARRTDRSREFRGSKCFAFPSFFDNLLSHEKYFTQSLDLCYYYQPILFIRQERCLTSSKKTRP